MRAERGRALGADHRRGFLDGRRVRFRADQARGEGDPGHAHGVQLGRGFLDGGLAVQRGGHDREREPRREQERGDAGRADGFVPADRGLMPQISIDFRPLEPACGHPLTIPTTCRAKAKTIYLRRDFISF